MNQMPPACLLRQIPRVLILGLTLTMGLVLGGERLPGAELPSPHQRPSAPQARKNEFKLLVTAANTPQAMKALKLEEHRAVKQSVCFFDTDDGALEANGLILRAREKAGEPGQSTVKLRAIDDATELSDVERAIQPEQDWTHESGPALSRSLDHASLSRGLVLEVAAGRAAVAELFDEAQRKMVSERMKNFHWESLRRYGPVKSKVWRQQWMLQGFPQKVTAELWQLQQGARTQDILEVSANAKAETDAQAQALARQFFVAAKAAGLGEPAGQTKTKTVLDFFKPGR